MKIVGIISFADNQYLQVTICNLLEEIVVTCVFECVGDCDLNKGDRTIITFRRRRRIMKVLKKEKNQKILTRKNLNRMQDQVVYQKKPLPILQRLWGKIKGL